MTVARFAYVLRGFLAARLLGPATFGQWNVFLLAFEYGQYAHFGVLNGLNKETAFRLGRGEPDEARRMEDAGLASMLLTSVGSWLLLLAGAFLFRRDAISPPVLAGLLLVGALVVVEEVVLTFVSVARAHGNIAIVSRTELLHAVVNLAVSAVLLVPFGLPGLMVGWVATRAGAMIYLLTRSGLRIRPRPDRARAWHLLRRGSWIFLYLVMAALLRTVDRAVILGGVGVETLGLYAMAATVAGLVANLPAALSFVLYPDFLRRFGATGDPAALAGSLERWSLALASVTPLLWLALSLAVPPMLYYALPDYLGAVPAVRLLLAGSIFGSLAQVPIFFLLAIDRDAWLVWLSALGALLGVGLCLAALRLGWGIEGVAAAKALADTAYGAALLFVAARLGRGSARAAARLVARCAVPAFLALGVVAVCAVWPGLPAWRPSEPDLAATALRAALVAALSLPPLLWWGRRIGLAHAWREARR